MGRLHASRRRYSAGFAAALWPLLAGWLLAGSAGLRAEGGPSVADLLTVCERARAQGDTGVDAATCEWFAVPCDCKPPRDDDDRARWCMPAEESVDAAVLKVIEALRDAAEHDAALLSADVHRAVPPVMAALYPCGE